MDAKYFITPHNIAAYAPDAICGFRHNFHEHPMLQLDALEQLAHRIMPSGGCRFVAPGLKSGSEFHHEDRPVDGRSLEEVFARVGESGSWIALYRIQQDPEYNQFLQGVQKTMQRVLGYREQIYHTRGFVFISSPPSVTPYHIDRENNFWMHVRGKKTLYLWDREDETVLPRQHAEDFIVQRNLDNVRLDDMIRRKAIPFECGPGDGVYFPSTTPHMTESDASWVCPGDSVSVSIGMVFYTNQTRRDAQVHAANKLLRRLGLNPTPPRRSLPLDHAKALLGRAVVTLRERLRGYDPPPGMR